MKSLFMLVIGLAATAAMAGTVKCANDDGDLNVKINLRDDGTAVMVLSNPELQRGNKTIVSFDDAEDDSTSSTIRVAAKVDLRKNDIRRGELIGGTKLGQLKAISFYGWTDSQGEDRATLTLSKRKGGKVRISLTCPGN